MKDFDYKALYVDAGRHPFQPLDCKKIAEALRKERELAKTCRLKQSGLSKLLVNKEYYGNTYSSL